MAKKNVEPAITEATERLNWLVKCQEDYLSQERQHRITRRRREHALKEANPKLPVAALELLLEADGEYLAAFVTWKSAQVTRKRAEGEYEIAKMRAWAAIRTVG